MPMMQSSYSEPMRPEIESNGYTLQLGVNGVASKPGCTCDHDLRPVDTQPGPQSTTLSKLMASNDYAGFLSKAVGEGVIAPKEGQSFVSPVVSWEAGLPGTVTNSLSTSDSLAITALVMKELAEKTDLKNIGGSLEVKLRFTGLDEVKGFAEIPKNNESPEEKPLTTINLSWQGGSDIKPDTIEEQDTPTFFNQPLYAEEFPDQKEPEQEVEQTTQVEEEKEDLQTQQYEEEPQYNNEVLGRKEADDKKREEEILYNGELLDKKEEELKGRMAELGRHIENLQTETMRKGELLDQKEAENKEREEQINQKEALLDQREAECNEREARIQQKEELLDQREAENKERDEQIQQNGKLLDQAEAESNRRKNDIPYKVQALDRADRELKERENNMPYKVQALDRMDRELKERENDMERRKAILDSGIFVQICTAKLGQQQGQRQSVLNGLL